MYKTVRHKVTEEHYINGRLVKSTASDSLPTVVINEKTMNFRMDNRTLWTRYSLGMINFSVALYGNMNSGNVLENLKRAGQACGDYFVPYYGLNAAKKIGSLLIVIAVNGSKVAESVQSKRDIVPYETIWDKQIDELATYLNQLNPQHWPKDTLDEMFINLTALWADDFKARLAEDFVADSIALDNIVKVAVSGIPNHVYKGYTSIADIISKGIIAQSPMSFVE
jgi:hypothetical protein